MAVTITAAGLVAAYPEWAAVNTNQPAVVARAIAIANEKEFSVYDGYDEQETERRYLEACSYLYRHPYGRDMHKPDDASADPYRTEIVRLDGKFGGAWRGPGWTLPSGVS